MHAISNVTRDQTSDEKSHSIQRVKLKPMWVQENIDQVLFLQLSQENFRSIFNLVI